MTIDLPRSGIKSQVATSCSAFDSLRVTNPPQKWADVHDRFGTCHDNNNRLDFNMLSHIAEMPVFVSHNVTQHGNYTKIA